jgi:hypothetical protein
LIFWDNDISPIGLLKVGVPKTWDDSQKNLGYIRNAGVKQFMSTYNRVKDLKGDALLWGDEIEYGVFRIDPETKKVRLSLRAKEVSVENSSSDRAEANLLPFACDGGFDDSIFISYSGLLHIVSPFGLSRHCDL